MNRRQPPYVALALCALGTFAVSALVSRLNARATTATSVEHARFLGAGQAVSIRDALIAFTPTMLAPEFDSRDPKRERSYRFVVIEDAATERRMAMLFFRDNFSGSDAFRSGYSKAEVRGTLARVDPALRARLLAALPKLEANPPELFLDDMEFPEIPALSVLLGVFGVGLLAYGGYLLLRWVKPVKATVAMETRLARPHVVRDPRTGKTVARETQRTCPACAELNPFASKICGNCHAPIELEYFVMAAVPLDGFDRYVPIVCKVLSVSDYQARQPLARPHTALPYHHLEGYHVKGPSGAAPFRLVGRGIPSLVTAQALGASLTETGVPHVIVGSDELVRGPFPRMAIGLNHDDDRVTFQFDQGGGETGERTVAWNRVATVVFSADMPLRGTMTLARDLREGMPRDASSYVIDIYERDQTEGIRIAEDGFYHWEFLKLGGSERPADRFGRLLDLIQTRCPSVEIHFVTGVYRGQKHLWRLNFHSRLTYLVGEKSGWLRTEGPPKLDGYEMLEKVGEGAMGAVYRARQKKLGRIVAVKVVAPHLAAEKNFLARFETEAKAVASLSHPNIVQVMDLSEWGGRFFMVMEFVEGKTLQQLLRASKRLPEVEALRIGGCVASALEHAAQRNIVHRDVKPDNIFLTHDGEVKLGDWGLAKDLGEDLGLTATGTAVGTPYYMSPEQARARKDLDIRSDFYALGATVYHLVAGRPPFTGNSPTEVLMRHLTAPPTDPRKYNPELSPGTVALLLRLLAKNPNDRCAPGDKVSGEFERLRALVSTAIGNEVSI